MKKKWVSYIKYGVLGLGVVGVAIGLPFAVINSKSYNLFAEIIVSDNISVLADSSFSETTYDGFKTFINTKEGKEVLPTASVIPQSSGVWRRPGDTIFARETTYRGLFASGKDMIIAPGFNHENAIRNVATDSNFLNKGFLLLDSSIGSVGNVSSFTFRADQSGFLTGIAASIFLNNNVSVFGTGGLKVGAFVGQAFPSTMDFLAGFQSGVFAWNESLTTQNVGGVTRFLPVEWISLGDTQVDYQSGGFGVGGGVAKAQQLLDAGADVIMPIAGPQTADVVGEIIKRNVTAVVAGVDSSQELQTINKPLPLKSGQVISGGFQPSSGEHTGKDMIIQFSAVKHLDKATEGVLNAIFNKTDPNNVNAIIASPNNGSLIGGFGFSNTGSIENRAAGTSDAGVKQLLLNDHFKSWVDASNLIVWSEVQKDKTFLAMTNSGNLYVNGGNTLTSASQGKILPNVFFSLQNGVATASDIAFGLGSDGKPDKTKPIKKLDGSLWEILR